MGMELDGVRIEEYPVAAPKQSRRRLPMAT